jgi:hypothetical protein
MYHTPLELVPLTLTAVAIPFAASVLEPVDVPPANLSVSEVIAMVAVVALGPAINVIVVPMG